MTQMHYLPLSAPFFAFLVGAFLVVLALIQIGILRYAYLRIGISSRAAGSCCWARCSAATSTFP